MRSKIYLSRPSKYHSLKYALEENNIREFTHLIEQYLANSCKVVLLNSGTAALHLALILSDIKEGDEVLCQTATFSASVNPIRYQKAIPVFVGSEKETYNMCPVALEVAIKDRILKGKKPKAIIVVHLYGMPSKIDQISAIAKKYKIYLIEDAAEAFGAIYKGQKCGTYGDFGILSFNTNKIMTTFGGGALVCKSEKHQKEAVFLATQAKDTAPHYEHSVVGFNYVMSDLLAGVGREQMEHLENYIALRRLNNIFYKDIFKQILGVTLLKEPNSDYFSTHWLSCILIDTEITGFTSEQLRLHLEANNIASRPMWKPMHLQPVFRGYPYYGSDFSEYVFKNGLCLPSSSNLQEVDKKRIFTSIQEFVSLKSLGSQLPSK
jgi:dTDP-4-amino-4,6-dideoxygalactose transaminase